MMNLRRSGVIRWATVLGVLAAVSVPLLLLLSWGHVGGGAFHGSDLQRSFRIELIALSGVVVVLGIAGILRPIHPAALLLCAAAMAAELVVIVIEWNNKNVFNLDLVWHWAPATLIAGLVLSGVGLAVWLGLFVTSVARKACPDCAETVPRNAIDCPHCGYRFPLSRGFKRCGSCERPVKAEARVCRFCNHRFGEQVERVSS